MTRPLMQSGVIQLEALFTSSKSDLKVLKQLEHELQFRHVPRAVALLAEVQAAMYCMPSAGSAAEAPIKPFKLEISTPQQPGLWERPQAPPIIFPPVVAQPSPVASRKPPKTEMETSQNHQSVPAISLEEAHKILKTTPTSTWQSIEQNRRQLVQQSHPARIRSMSAEKRNQVIADAKRINAAYATIQRTREN
jgi:hypothetical protein